MFPGHPDDDKEDADLMKPLAGEIQREYRTRSARAKAAEKSRQDAGMRFFNAFVALGTTVAVFMLFLWLMNLVR